MRKCLSAEKVVEVAKSVDIAIGEHLSQFYLVETIQFVAGVAMVESPQFPVGEDAPCHSRCSDVEINLIVRVAIRERVAGAV